MSGEKFYEIYRKLTLGRSKPEDAFSAIDELARVWRDRKAATSLEQSFAEAGSCLHEIAQSSAMFAKAMSRWLSTREDVELAKALLHKGSVQHLQQPAAELYDLSTIDEATAILVGCRLCTCIATPAISLGWALSLCLAYPTSGKVQHAVDGLLEYHVNEFPLTTRRLLSADESPFKGIALAATALAFLDDQEAQLSSLPKLREFAMTPEMRLTLSSLRRREGRDINHHARKKSVFMQFCKVEQFKYSHKTALEFTDGEQVHETSMEMSSYGVEVELPVSERTDPQAGMLSRRRLWRGVPK